MLSCVCVHVCVCICMYVCVWVDLIAPFLDDYLIYVCICLCVGAHISISEYVCECVCLSLWCVCYLWYDGECVCVRVV